MKKIYERIRFTSKYFWALNYLGPYSFNVITVEMNILGHKVFKSFLVKLQVPLLKIRASCILFIGKESHFQGIYLNDCFLSLSHIFSFPISFGFLKKWNMTCLEFIFDTEYAIWSQRAIYCTTTKFGDY